MNILDFKDTLFKAGEIALNEQAKLNIETKPDQSIVTNGDLAVSRYLEQELKSKFPEFDVFSEEDSSRIPTSSKVFIIDPIDGTESYSRKQDSWSILVGILDNLVPVGGIIYQPSTGILYYSFKGTGAFMEHKGVSTNLKATGQGESKAIVSPKDYDEKNFLEKLNITNYTYSYSAALKIMEVAKGSVDIYPNFRKKCSFWDLAAPSAILEEAGGKIIYEEKINPSFSNSWINSKFCALGRRMTNTKIFNEK